MFVLEKFFTHELAMAIREEAFELSESKEAVKVVIKQN